MGVRKFFINFNTLLLYGHISPIVGLEPMTNDFGRLLYWHHNSVLVFSLHVWKYRKKKSKKMGFPYGTPVEVQSWIPKYFYNTENGHNWPCNFREEFEQCKIVHPQRTTDDGRRRTVIGHLSRLCDL